MNNFNSIAPVYDTLAMLIFGKSIRESQTTFFNVLKPNQHILICGGGTGWILRELDKLRIPLNIVYVEYSVKMLKRAQNREPFNHLSIKFINDDVFEFNLMSYDVVITNFFLDVFKPSRLDELIFKLKESIEDSGSWFVADFRNTGKWNHKALNYLMHKFFRVISSLESHKLQDFEQILIKNGLFLKDERFFFNGFIGSYHFKLA